MITQKELKKFVHYDPPTGMFTWKISTNGRIKIGSVAGSLENNGYIRLSISGTRYLAHRLAMVYVNGGCGEYIDHIDGDRSNNKISNLRCVTSSQNSQNARIGSRNTSGKIGVSLHRGGKWLACICVKGEYIYLGLHEEFSKAAAVRKQAEIDNGFHENHGGPCL